MLVSKRIMHTNICMHACMSLSVRTHTYIYIYTIYIYIYRFLRTIVCTNSITTPDVYNSTHPGVKARCAVVLVVLLQLLAVLLHIPVIERFTIETKYAAVITHWKTLYIMPEFLRGVLLPRLRSTCYGS